MRIGDYDTHEEANCYPLLEGHRWDAFLDDIKANGAHLPIWLYEGKILDGRNRYEAQRRLGIKPAFAEYTGNDPAGFVLSMNSFRRHQEALSYALSVTRMADLGKKERRRLKSQDALPGVDMTTAAMARQIEQDGTPELVAAVHRGEVDAAHAAALSQLEPDQQAEGIKRLTQADEVKPEPVRAKQTEETCQSVLVRLSPVEIAALRCLALLGDKSVHGEAREGSKVLRRVVPGVGR